MGDILKRRVMERDWWTWILGEEGGAGGDNRVERLPMGQLSSDW